MMMNKSFTPLWILWIVLLPGVPAFAQNEDAKLESFSKQYLDRYFKLRPVEATRLGDHRFDDQIEDASPAARAGWLALTRETLQQLPLAVNYTRLSRDSQIDYEIFQHALETDVWLTQNTHPFEEDPRTYNTYIMDSVYLLLTQSTLPLETNITHCLARMARIPAVIATAKATLTHPAAPILETAIRQNRGAIAFYENGLFKFVGDTPQTAPLRSAATPIVTALKDYQQFLEGPLMERATGSWRLGPTKFAHKLELVLDANMTADQVHADAQVEFSRVRNDMYVIARQLWSTTYPLAPLPPDDKEGRRETIQRVVAAVSQDHSRPEELLADARATVEGIRTFIRSHDILRLPDPDRCQVIEMPEFRRGNSLAYLENAPPLDPNASSFYAVSPPPSDWDAVRVNTFLEEYNRYMLPILTIHEAYPGHYVQLEYANHVDSLIRRVFQSGVYIEGWAVYGEQTMLDQGYGNAGLPMRLMQLKFYLRAVGNALLDHDMHCTQMTDDEALRFLTQDAFQSEGEAQLKIIRAKQSSVQLSSYFVGRMAHYRLRQQIEREMGDQFNLGRYHEAVLAPGSVPVKYLPELVRARLRQPR